MRQKLEAENGCRSSLRWLRFRAFPFASENFIARTIEPDHVIPVLHNRQTIRYLSVATTETDRDRAVLVFDRQVRPSTLLAKLSAFPRQNGLALALCDIGRINRSILLPQWWQNPEMRRNATAGPTSRPSRTPAYCRRRSFCPGIFRPGWRARTTSQRPISSRIRFLERALACCVFRGSRATHGHDDWSCGSR